MQPRETIGKTAAAGESEGADRRRRRRCPCDLFAEAVIRHRGSMFRGRLQDISQDGCFLMTRAHMHMELDAEVNLRFTFNGVECRIIAVVRNVRPESGVGLEFLFDDAHAEASFGALIRT